MFAFVHQKGKSHEHSTFLQILDNQEHVIKFLAQGFINKFTKQKAWGVPIFLEGINFILYADFLFRVFNFLFDFKHVLGTICVLCCVLLFTAIALMQHLNWQCGCMPAMEHSMCLAVFATIWT